MDKRDVSIESALEACSKDYPSFTYPWEGLESFLSESKLSSLPLVGYGSLINEASAARTINTDTSARRAPVVAYGAIRVFNYRMSPAYVNERYGTPESSKHLAALNCERTGRGEDRFNGILTHVAPDTLGAFRDREKDYALQPVVYQLWDQPDSKPQVAYILELKPGDGSEGDRYDSTILPHIDYTRLCQTGAQAISEAFLDYFNKSTFLADKETSLLEYALPDVDPLPSH
jgi:hypothetical protein